MELNASILKEIDDSRQEALDLLMAAKYIAKNKLTPKDGGMLLVANSGEEELGNLKGCKAIMEKFGDRVTEFVTFDGPFGSIDRGGKICTTAVGSKRYKIEIDTEGGHSYGMFGIRNAIAYLASLIDTLYTIKVPKRGKTTYHIEQKYFDVLQEVVNKTDMNAAKAYSISNGYANPLPEDELAMGALGFKLDTKTEQHTAPNKKDLDRMIANIQNVDFVFL